MVSLLAVVSLVNAEPGCDKPLPKDYERIYCEIIAAGAGKGLPALEDFRSNSARIQNLLLKRPAQAIGIDLPTYTELEKINEAKASKKHNRNEIVKKNSVTKTIHFHSFPAEAKPKPQSITPQIPERPQSQPMAVSELQKQCQLINDYINCGSVSYYLVVNQNNSVLDKQALSASNKMGMRTYTGSKDDKEAIKKYLSESYRHYIEKMLEIGLGAATMSFSKFYYTYQQVAELGHDFAQRFEIMYNFLKKDKASMAVKARYSDVLPSKLEQCARLSANLLVCDQDEHNWIYKKKSG